MPSPDQCRQNFHGERHFGAVNDGCVCTGLNKPYNDGGYENSSRVFAQKGFDDPVRHCSGGMITFYRCPPLLQKRW